MLKKIFLFVCFYVIVHASDYFPIAVSNYWIYEVSNADEITRMKWEVISESTIFDLISYTFEISYYDHQGNTLATIHKVISNFPYEFVYLDTLVPAIEFYNDTSTESLDTVNNYSFNGNIYSNVQRRTFFAEYPFGEKFQINFNVCEVERPESINLKVVDSPLTLLGEQAEGGFGQ